MSAKSDDGSDGNGCLFLICMVIAGICIGNLYGANYGALFASLAIALVAGVSIIRGAK